MILAIDIGNTNIVCGCLNNSKPLFIERLATGTHKTDLEYAIQLKHILELNHITPEDIEGSIISSVVPPVSGVFKLAVEKLLHKSPLMVHPGLNTGLTFLVDSPKLLGSDRVVDAVAASTLYAGPLVVIDMGTSTTISAISKDKQFLGGFISPGVRVALDSLTLRTSKLPSIGLEEPKNIIGTNTIDCMKSGIIYGTASILDGVIARMEKEIGEPVTVVATGGLARFIIPYCKREIHYDDSLLLKGLEILYQKNK